MVSRAARGDFVAVAALPPAGSFSRLRYANRRGLQPLRSQEFPGGLPWLRGEAKQRCANEDAVITLCCRVCEAVAAGGRGVYALAHPEFLGPAERGLPPSFWELPGVRALGKAAGCQAGALYLCGVDPGARAAAPTRISTNATAVLAHLYPGEPVIGSDQRPRGGRVVRRPAAAAGSTGAQRGRSADSTQQAATKRGAQVRRGLRQRWHGCSMLWRGPGLGRCRAPMSATGQGRLALCRHGGRL